MKEKRYFIELVVKDSDTLEPVRSVSTSSDYPDSFFNYPPHHNVTSDIRACVGILFSMPLTKEK